MCICVFVKENYFEPYETIQSEEKLYFLAISTYIEMVQYKLKGGPKEGAFLHLVKEILQNGLINGPPLQL